MKDGKQMGPEPSSDQIVPDSREKLEEEVCSFFASNKLMRDSAMEAFVTGIVYGWLDRQAAITEQECIDQRIADQIGSIWKDEKVRKLQAKVDELTEERDELRARLDGLDRLRMEPPVEAALDAGAGKDSREKLESDARDWIDKRRHHPLGGVGLFEKLQGWLDRQAEITEREITSTGVADWCASCSLRDGLHLAMDAKEGLRKSLDETIEERNELQAKLDDFDGDCYRGATVVQWYEHSVRLQGRLDEMEQTHMRLPVDAEDVPVRPGDYMALGDSRGEVKALSYAPYNEPPWQMQLDDFEWYATVNARHVQPDTVESVLEEFHGKLWSDDEEQMALLEEYAERIRKAVKR